MMTKNDTIEAIKNINPTASPEFLEEFSIDDLNRYLDRLHGHHRHSVDTVVESITIDNPDYAV
jgi:hypothetical protein